MVAERLLNAAVDFSGEAQLPVSHACAGIAILLGRGPTFVPTTGVPTVDAGAGKQTEQGAGTATWSRCRNSAELMQEQAWRKQAQQQVGN